MKFFKHVLMEAAGGGNAGAGGGGGSNGGAAAAGAGAVSAGSAGGSGTGSGGTAGIATGSTTPGAGAGTTTTDWTTGFNEDVKGYVQNKGWKDPTQLVDSYRNMEKLVGVPQNELIRMPKEDDTAGWESVHTRLGRPATPDAYKLPVPEGQDPGFSKWASEQFHKLGLSEKQGKALAENWNGFQAQNVTQAKEAYQAKVTAETASLKKEWGAAHDQNMAVAQRAAREFGADVKMIDAMEATIGLAATMKFFSNIGSKLGESGFVAGNGNSGAGSSGPMTPAQAKSQISSLKADPSFVAKYVANDAGARAKMDQLHKYAYPEA